MFKAGRRPSYKAVMTKVDSVTAQTRVGVRVCKPGAVDRGSVTNRVEHSHAYHDDLEGSWSYASRSYASIPVHSRSYQITRTIAEHG